MNTKVIDTRQKAKSIIMITGGQSCCKQYASRYTPNPAMGLEFNHGSYYYRIDSIDLISDWFIINYSWSESISSNDPQDANDGDGTMECQIWDIDPDYQGEIINDEAMEDFYVSELFDWLRNRTKPDDGL